MHLNADLGIMSWLGKLIDSSANTSSVLGLLISAYGLYKAFSEAREAKNAAMGAKEAVDAALGRLYRSNIVSDCAEAITLVQEIKRLHNEQRLDGLLERYTALENKLLILVMENDASVDTAAKKSIQLSITSSNDAQSLLRAFMKSKTDAQKSEIIDKIYHGEDALFAQFQQLYLALIGIKNKAQQDVRLEAGSGSTESKNAQKLTEETK